MKKYFCILALIATYTVQAQFVSSGVIEYTRTTNNHMALKVEMADREQSRNMDDWLKMIPKNSTKTYLMTFNEEKSFYRFDKDGPDKMPTFGMKDPAAENIVVKNFLTNRYEAEKDVMNSIFLIKDSMPQYTWKIDDEIRQIAGYPCRKATTVILDSVYVIAFYTENILVSGGPESFNGLPGMILGLAVPRLYTSWFATRVEFTPYDPSIEKPFSTKRVKELTTETMVNEIAESMKDWGEFGNQVIYKIAL